MFILTGGVPVLVIDTVRAGILSGKPEQEVQAAVRLLNLDKINPALLEPIPANELDRAFAIGEFAGLDLPPRTSPNLAHRRTGRSILLFIPFHRPRKRNA